MKVKIYQLPVEHERCFRGFDAGKRVPVEDYELVWEGELIGRTLEKVYRELNYAHPADYKARSLSVSDIVEIVREGGRGDKWFCDSVGWVLIEGPSASEVIGSHVHPTGSGLSGEKEILKACPQCGEVPEIGYCCGEYFIFHPSKVVGMCYCSSFTEMHSSEETEIKAWNRRVDNEQREAERS